MTLFEGFEFEYYEASEYLVASEHLSCESSCGRHYDLVKAPNYGRNIVLRPRNDIQIDAKISHKQDSSSK